MTSPETERAISLIDRRLEDLAEANAIYGKDQRLNAPDKIARNEREISWLKDLRSEVVLIGHAPTPDHAELIARLRGRALFLRNRGGVKSPDLMEQAARALSDTSTDHEALRYGLTGRRIRDTDDIGTEELTELYENSTPVSRPDRPEAAQLPTPQESVTESDNG